MRDVGLFKDGKRDAQQLRILWVEWRLEERDGDEAEEATDCERGCGRMGLCAGVDLVKWEDERGPGLTLLSY